jgi:hypothetical protein
MATVMFAETFDNFQRSTRLISESGSYTETEGVQEQGAERNIWTREIGSMQRLVKTAQ